MRFSDYTNIMTDRYGFQFVRNDVMVGKTEEPCLNCGCPSKYIEVFSEAHFCSDECIDSFYKQVAKMEEIADTFEPELNRISSTYQISEDHAGCYLSNYENEYICHKHNGGCKNIKWCREIREKEKR